MLVKKGRMLEMPFSSRNQKQPKLPFFPMEDEIDRELEALVWVMVMVGATSSSTETYITKRLSRCGCGRLVSSEYPCLMRFFFIPASSSELKAESLDLCVANGKKIHAWSAGNCALLLQKVKSQKWHIVLFPNLEITSYYDKNIQPKSA